MTYQRMKKGSKTTPKKLPTEVNQKEFLHLLDFVKQRRHKLAIGLAWGSGLRISEVIKLEKRDFNFDLGQIKVREGKGKKDRIVPIPKYFKEEFLEHIPFPYDARALQKVFKRTCEKSGLKEKKPDMVFHSLRHGFATHSLRNGINLRSIQIMLGHSDLSSTGIYLNLCPDEIMKEYREKF